VAKSVLQPLGANARNIARKRKQRNRVAWLALDLDLTPAQKNLLVPVKQSRLHSLQLRYGQQHDIGQGVVYSATKRGEKNELTCPLRQDVSHSQLRVRLVLARRVLKELATLFLQMFSQHSLHGIHVAHHESRL
jgi:hypothetical protein